MKIKNKKCVECGKPAVAFYPMIDIDVTSYPYCRKCLEKVKFALLIKLIESDPPIKEFKAIEHKNLKSPE